MKTQNKDFVRFQLATKTFGELVSIPVVDEIEEDGKNKTIRYVPGESSIYKDEQSTSAEKIKTEIIFVHGMLAVPLHDRNKLEYLKKCGYNGSNPNRTNGRELLFRVYDPDAERARLYRTSMGITNVENIIRDLAVDELHAIATVLNMPIDRTEEAVRWDVLVIARRDPDRFIMHLRSPQTKRKYNVMKAIRNGVIHLDRTINAISWPKGGIILQVPMGSEVVDALVNYLETEQGQAVEQAIYAQLYPASPPKEQTEKKTKEKEQVEGNEESKKTPPNSYPELMENASDSPNWKETVAWKTISKAMELGVVDKTPNGYFKYEKKGVIGGKNFIAYFEGNPERWAMMLNDIEKAQVSA